MVPPAEAMKQQPEKVAPLAALVAIRVPSGTRFPIASRTFVTVTVTRWSPPSENTRLGDAVTVAEVKPEIRIPATATFCKDGIVPSARASTSCTLAVKIWPGGAVTF